MRIVLHESAVTATMGSASAKPGSTIEFCFQRSCLYLVRRPAIRVQRAARQQSE